MRFLRRVDAVTLEQPRGIGAIGHVLEHEGHDRRLVGLCHLAKRRREAAPVVRAVVGRHLHPHEQNLGAGALRGLGHGIEVVHGELQRQATQRVVAAEFDDHDRRTVLGEQCWQARTPAGGRVAADAGVDHAGGALFLGQFRLQQGHPAGAARQAVFRAQGVAQHQHDFVLTPGRGLGQRCPHGQAPERTRDKVSSIQNKKPFMSQATRPAIIAVEHVFKSVSDSTGTLDILRDIDFSLAEQETAAIVGASGSGKSTLLSIIAGLDTPTRGTVRLAGQDLFVLDEDDRAALRARQVGFVFQSFQLMGNLTALENVMLPLELAGRKDSRTAATEMLARVGLSARLGHYPRVLSGGEQQRVALARAFVVQPAVLLADEPTGSLDFATGETIMELMFDLNRELGTTLVLVTHDRGIAARCAHRIVIEAGQVVSS